MPRTAEIPPPRTTPPQPVRTVFVFLAWTTSCSACCVVDTSVKRIWHSNKSQSFSAWDFHSFAFGLNRPQIYYYLIGRELNQYVTDNIGMMSPHTVYYEWNNKTTRFENPFTDHALDCPSRKCTLTTVMGAMRAVMSAYWWPSTLRRFLTKLLRPNTRFSGFEIPWLGFGMLKTQKKMCGPGSASYWTADPKILFFGFCRPKIILVS